MTNKLNFLHSDLLNEKGNDIMRDILLRTFKWNPLERLRLNEISNMLESL